MREIPLSKGFVTLVDNEDFANLQKFSWHYCNGYARRSISKRDVIYMHSQIFGGFKVDHHDGNGLNNQRFNLRKSTSSQNSQNKKKGAGSSKYKGVWWQATRNRWEAAIKINGKKIYLGYFVDELEAACAYNAAARKLFGEFARLNLFV